MGKRAKAVDFGSEQIVAAESGNSLTRIFLLASILSGRFRLLVRSRRKDAGLGTRPGEEPEPTLSPGHVRAMWVVQGYLLALLAADIMSSALVIGMATLFSYRMLLSKANLGFLADLPVLPWVMGRLWALASWIPAAVEWVSTAIAVPPQAMAAVTSGGDASLVSLCSPLAAAVIYWAITALMRANIIGNMREVSS